MGPCCEHAQYGFDQDYCREWAAQELNGVIPRSDRNAVVYDETAAGACIAAVARTVRSCKDLGQIDDACAGVYIGKLEEGDQCQINAECAVPGGDVWCMDRDMDGIAQCADVRGSAGDSCFETCVEDGDEGLCSGNSLMRGEATCYLNDGLYCHEELGCTPVHAIGDTCELDTCAMEAYCDNGTCVARKSAGQSCTGYDDCKIGLLCLSDGVCGAPKTARQGCNGGDCKGECVDGVCVDEALVTGPAMCTRLAD